MQNRKVPLFQSSELLQTSHMFKLQLKGREVFFKKTEKGRNGINGMGKIVLEHKMVSDCVKDKNTFFL